MNKRRDFHNFFKFFAVSLVIVSNVFNVAFLRFLDDVPIPRIASVCHDYSTEAFQYLVTQSLEFPVK